MSEFLQEFDILEKIMQAAPQPFEMRFASRPAAIAFRHRLYKARIQDRKASMGFSSFDPIIIHAPVVQPDETWVMLAEVINEGDPVPGLLKAGPKEGL